MEENSNKDRELEKDDHTPRKATSSNDPSHHEPGADMTDHPDTEGRENQERLPPHGQAKATSD